MTVKQVDAATLKTWLDNKEAVLIDVREPAEHKTSNIPGATLKPLGLISSGDLPKQGKKVVVHCQKGSRGTSACQKLIAENSAIEVYNLQGGIEAWQQAGLPTGAHGGKMLPLDRQVQLTIGLFVLVFSLLAYFVNPAFSLVAAFFGAGLTNAGLTGWCGLGKAMAMMPWNQS
jgi:rhodanese-related sulfurtransferase